MPIPEEQAAEGQAMEDATQQALSEMQRRGVAGHEVGHVPAASRICRPGQGCEHDLAMSPPRSGPVIGVQTSLVTVTGLAAAARES